MPPIVDYKTGVYAIRNTQNGKQYVGSAALTFASRWAIHRCDLKRGRHHSNHLQKAWDKYGEASFEFVVLQRCKPEDCIRLEQWWLDKLRTYERDKGYNLSPTAGSALGTKHAEDAKTKHKDPEWEKKRIDGRRGKKWTKEMKERVKEEGTYAKDAKMRAHLMLAAMTRASKPRSIEARIKTAAKHRGMKRSPEAIANMRAAQQARFAK